MVVCSWNTRFFSDLALGVHNPNLLHHQIIIPKERCCVTYHHNSTTHFLSLKALQAFYSLTLITISLNIFYNLLNSICVHFWNSLLIFENSKETELRSAFFLFSPKDCQSITFHYFAIKLHETPEGDLMHRLSYYLYKPTRIVTLKIKVSYWKIRNSREGLWWDPASASAFKKST